MAKLKTKAKSKAKAKPTRPASKKRVKKKLHPSSSPPPTSPTPPIPPIPPPKRPPAPSYSGPPEDEPLSAEDRLRLANYLIDRNGTRMWLEMYPGTSYSSSAAAASEWLKRPNIAKEAQAGMNALVEKSNLRAETALEELTRLAYADPVYMVDQNDEPLTLRQIPIQLRRAIHSIKWMRERRETTGRGKNKVTTTYRMVEYRLHNKLEALDRLCVYLGIKIKELPDIEQLLVRLPPDVATVLRTLMKAQVDRPQTSNHVTVLPTPTQTPATVPVPTPTTDKPDGNQS